MSFFKEPLSWLAHERDSHIQSEIPPPGWTADKSPLRSLSPCVFRFAARDVARSNIERLFDHGVAAARVCAWTNAGTVLRLDKITATSVGVVCALLECCNSFFATAYLLCPARVLELPKERLGLIDRRFRVVALRMLSWSLR